MATCKWCGEENAEGVNVCVFCGQDMSVFEDSGTLKNLNTAMDESSKARIPVSSNTFGSTSGSGSLNAGAVRSAARAQQIQQAQKKTEYVTRNQLKQVAYRLDKKSRTLTALTVIIAIAAVAGIALGVLAFIRGNVKPDNTATESSIAQLQSQVSTLELELQGMNAKLEEMQQSSAPQEPVNVPNPAQPDGDTSTAVNITTSGSEPSEPEPANPGIEVQTGSSIDADTEIETTFERIDGDATSIYALVDQTFEGTTNYQWQKSPNMETWSDVNTSAAKTNKLKISIDDYLRNNAYRCRITNVDSKGVTVVCYTEIVDYNAYQIWSLIG